MACDICKQFPLRASKFEEIEVNVLRHATLYRCLVCGTFFELIEEERSVRFTPVEELKKYYPKLSGL